MALGTLGIGEQINGVNLGNWLVLEKWMKPGIFAASGEADEIWLHRATESAELEALLTRHRDTYITEADFRNIAAHGCNLVRIPVPYFIFGDVSGHPGCIEYLDRAFDWAERTGLKILIDLHTVPGSQNGFDNGGLTGVVRWHHSVFCQVGVGRFGVSFSPCERRVSGRFGVGRSCWLLVIALVIA